MKFKVGQLWKSRGGDIFKIVNIHGNMFSWPVLAESDGYKTSLSFSLSGKYTFEDKEDINDLIELVSEPEETKMKEVKDDDWWASSYRILPNVNDIVEVIAGINAIPVPKKARFLVMPSEGKYGFYGTDGHLIKDVNFWRPIKQDMGILEFKYDLKWIDVNEKKPDFSRLNKGDLIIVYYWEREEKYPVFFRELKNEISLIAVQNEESSSEIVFLISKIKKITRINIEDKTFEEI